MKTPIPTKAIAIIVTCSALVVMGCQSKGTQEKAAAPARQTTATTATTATEAPVPVSKQGTDGQPPITHAELQRLQQ